MLPISNLHVSVGGEPILKGLTLDVPAGEAPAVIGPTGTNYGKVSPWWRTT